MNLLTTIKTLLNQEKNIIKSKVFLKKFFFSREIASIIGVIKYNFHKKRNARLNYLKK
jgi:hypothetical protein